MLRSLTDVYLDTYFGGDFGHDLRQAGWEGLFILGKVLILYALKSMIWKQNWLRQSRSRLTTWSCEQALSELGECLSVGPAGEHGVRIASPITAGRRAAGRGGSGAQFGFKNLKAITVKATGKPRFAKEPDLDKASQNKEQRWAFGEEVVTRSMPLEPQEALFTPQKPAECRPLIMHQPPAQCQK